LFDISNYRIYRYRKRGGVVIAVSLLLLLMFITFLELMWLHLLVQASSMLRAELTNAPKLFKDALAVHNRKGVLAHESAGALPVDRTNLLDADKKTGFGTTRNSSMRARHIPSTCFSKSQLYKTKKSSNTETGS